ncbi:META domain-containing protein [Leucobacter albus]|uniref:META domain-containing protein n=1 Tax=Leucobacter albus TaxID=272210 RepID=A0ABW3TT06_9MICO
MSTKSTAPSPRIRRGLAASALLGAAALVLTACAGSPSVADTTWGKIDTEGEPAMTFTADGGAHGSDGCNIVNGKWTEKDGKVMLSQLASTMMFCEGVDTWLSQAATAVAKGDTITFNDESGKEIGSLTKAEFTAPE